MCPWLSVIMPTYNGARFLEQALASVAAQGDDGIEVIAVDDGSTDATLDMLRRWLTRVRLTIIERQHGGNWVTSTAAGMAAARGAYLCWLHQDDAWHPRRGAAIRRALATHPSAALIAHPCWYSDAHGRRIGYWRCPLPRGARLLSFREAGASLVVQCSIAACGTVFSAEAARSVGPPDGALRYHADWDYWLRLSRLGRTLHVPAPLASFRIHAASQTIGLASEADSRFAEARTILRRHLPHFAAAGGDSDYVERLAGVSAEVNRALNLLLAGQRADLAGLLCRIAALGSTGCADLLRESRLVERCVSRLQASAGLRPALSAGLAAIVRAYLPREIRLPARLALSSTDSARGSAR